MTGAAGPGSSNWRDVRGEGRCHPAPAMLYSFPLGLSQGNLFPRTCIWNARGLQMPQLLVLTLSRTDTHTHTHLPDWKGGGPGSHGGNEGQGQARIGGSGCVSQCLPPLLRVHLEPGLGCPPRSSSLWPVTADLPGCSLPESAQVPRSEPGAADCHPARGSLHDKAAAVLRE